MTMVNVLRRTTRGIQVVGLIVLAVTVAGCASSNPFPVDMPTATPSASPSPTPNDGQKPTPQAEPGGVERVGAWPVQEAVDGGPRDYAMGEVVTDGQGHAISYMVARGDIIDFVAERLGIEGQYLVALNSVRRGRTGNLWEGDVLNLDPHTITSVGTINGEILDEPPPKPMPVQR